MLVNQAGATVWEGQYSAFGIQLNRMNQNGITTQTLRFPGQYADSETQLYYNWNRYYCPEFGRYITSDPIGLSDGVNSYSYVNAHPIDDLDPKGLFGYNCGLEERQRRREEGRRRHPRDTTMCEYYNNVANTEGCTYHKSAYNICKGNDQLFSKMANGLLSACAKTAQQPVEKVKNCVRACLVNADKKARTTSSCQLKKCRSDESSGTCTKRSCIDQYHKDCFQKCGVPKLCYGGYYDDYFPW